MFTLLPTLLATTSLALAQVAQDPVAETVRVPSFPNSTCPIMGKKVSLPLYADTTYGRIYVCCKPCIRKVHADVEAAYKTAYPSASAVENALCPVSGESIGEHRTTVLLQGLSVALCCAGCVDEARQNAQVTLTRAKEPGIADIDNKTCAVDGKPVEPNAFVIINTSLVRLSSPAHLADVQKAPLKVLDRARAIRAGQTPPAAHRHVIGKGNPEEGR